MLQSHSRSSIKRRTFTSTTLKNVMASSAASAVQHDTNSKKFVMHLENGRDFCLFLLKKLPKDGILFKDMFVLILTHVSFLRFKILDMVIELVA